MKKEIKEIIKKYELKKINKNDNSLYLSYDYKLYLKNLKTNWYIKFEDKTRKSKFYSVYTRFDNYDVLKDINEIIRCCNTWSGKCNCYCYDFNEIKCFISNIVILDKCYKQAA